MPTARCRRLLLVLALVLLPCLAGAQPSLRDSGDIINILPLDLPPKFNFKIPPKPATHVLDNADFLSAEKRAQLDAELTAVAQKDDVHVYVLVVPSVPKNGFEPFTIKVAEEWVTGIFGAVLIFDDATGALALQPSDEVTKRFYEFELSRLLDDQMSGKKRPRLSRDALEHSIHSVVKSLRELKARALQEERSSLNTRIVLGVLAVLVVGVIAFTYFRRTPTSSSKPDEPPAPAL